MGFIDLSVIKPHENLPGVSMKTPHGDRIMLSLVEIAEGAEVPLHSHMHEQGGIVVSGTMQLTIGDETRVLGPGEMYLIPGDVVHRAVAINGPVQAMDVFAPVREDYQNETNSALD